MAKKILALLLTLGLLLGLMGCSELFVEDDLDILKDVYEEFEQVGDNPPVNEIPSETLPAPSDAPTTSAPNGVPAEEGWYYSAEDVASYLYIYGYLPENFITKDEARELGWEGGSVENYAPGYAIGGDRFGNREGLLPEADGRVYYECDIDTNGANGRGAKRIVFSNDGLIYYTEDHYESFELLYGEE